MPYLFNGKELDSETGLYYYGARYYDARVSLWLNVDPLVEKTMQPYAYTNNNPVMLVDPDGRKPMDWIRRGIHSNWEYHSNIKSRKQAMDAGFFDYANGRGDAKSTYSTTLSRSGRDIGISQTVVLGENGNYTVNGEVFKAPDHYVDMKPVDDFGKLMAAYISLPVLLESISINGILLKGSVSFIGQVSVNQNLDMFDLGADMIFVPGISGGVGGAYDFNVLPDKNGQRFFNNSKNYKKIGFNAATSLLSSGLGNRYNPVLDKIENESAKKTVNTIIEVNNNMLEQGLNKEYEKE